MHQWREKNPKSQKRELPIHPGAALNMNWDLTKYDNIFSNRQTGEPLTQEQVWGGNKQESAPAKQEHVEALRKWNRRRQAAERRTRIPKAQAAEKVQRRFHEAQDTLWLQPLGPIAAAYEHDYPGLSTS
jgi:hypothetical protein